MLAGQAVIAIHNARDHASAEAEAKRFRLLNQAGQELGGISDLAQIDRAYDIVIRIAREQSESQQTVIRRYDESTQELVVVRAEHATSSPPFARMRIDKDLSGQVYEERRTIVVPDADNPPPSVRLKQSDEFIKSLLITPIQFEDHHYGTLGLSHKTTNHFQGADVELFQGLAHQLALTIHRLETAEASQTAERRANAAEAMGSIGQSAFELAHRLGNDLGAVRPYVNLIREAMSMPSDDSSQVVDESLDAIVHDVGSVLQLVRGLREELAQFQDETKETPGTSVISAQALLQEAANITTRLSPNVLVQLEVAPDTGLISAVYGQVANILRNLVTNAVEAMPDGGRLTLRARDHGQHIEFQVEDTGVGISAERQSRIFDLFYSTKGSFGFGLWSARRNALANGGDLRVESQSGQGATFVLLLPKSDMEKGGAK